MTKLPREIKREYLSNFIYVPVFLVVLTAFIVVGRLLGWAIVVDNWRLLLSFEAMSVIAGFITIFISYSYAYKKRFVIKFIKRKRRRR